MPRDDRVTRGPPGNGTGSWTALPQPTPSPPRGTGPPSPTPSPSGRDASPTKRSSTDGASRTRGVNPWRSPPDVAADGVDEILAVHLAARARDGRRFARTGRIEVHSTDTGDRWLVELTATIVRTRAAAPGEPRDTRIAATAAELYLDLWGRARANLDHGRRRWADHIVAGAPADWPDRALSPRDRHGVRRAGAAYLTGRAPQDPAPRRLERHHRSGRRSRSDQPRRHRAAPAGTRRHDPSRSRNA